MTASIGLAMVGPKFTTRECGRSVSIGFQPPNPEMSLWTVIPVKPFSEGKSRLAGYISPQERHKLNCNLLTRTLDAIRLADIDSETVVVSRDNDALDVAARLGSHVLTEEPSTPQSLETGSQPIPAAPEIQLNAALAQAACYAMAQGATRVLVLPTDMPNLTAEDVRTMASTHGRAPHINIAPSRDGGTNALMLQPPQAIPFAFGRDSFQRHRRLAAESGIPVQVVESASLVFDIDLPEDYELVFGSQSSGCRFERPVATSTRNAKSKTDKQEPLTLS